jgi:hypothetical protein
MPRHKIVVFLALLAAICSASKSSAQRPQCELGALDFPDDSLIGTLRTLRKNIAQFGAGTIKPLYARIEFSPPQFSEVFQKEVVLPTFVLFLDANGVITEWESTVRSKTDSEGCSSTRSENFRWSTNPDGSMRGDFHIRHTKRACYWFFGEQKNHVATIEADAWQDFRLSIAKGGQGVSLGLSGGATDNVPDELEFLAKVLGNLLALEPISSLLLELDEQIFAALKAQRDALEELSRFRLLGSSPVGGRTPIQEFCLNLVLTSARFDRSSTGLVLRLDLSIPPSEALSYGQACILRETLSRQYAQYTTIGVEGIDYTVARGDSAWRIAERLYGDGRYYPLLSVTREGTLRSLDNLAPGEMLRVEPLGAIRERTGIAVIEPGESFWRIGTQRAAPATPDAVVTQNMTRVEDLDVIYPLQVIELPPGASLLPRSSACDGPPQ